LPILGTRTEAWSDEAACAAAASVLARRRHLADGYIELHGPLGAGKTTFVRHLLHALGLPGRVKSPTYTVLEPYEFERDGAPFKVWHFDFYRFDDPQEWEDAGFRDIFAGAGLKLAEWPEKAEGLLPEPDLCIDIEPLADDARRVRLAAHSALGMEWLA
jgi:tRNA threonylcarbamoyladenosine biosynthesis protein TsaE